MKALPLVALPLVLGVAALASCGRETPSENIADTLDEAAEQSTPQAAESLENAAETVREEDLTDPEIGDAAMREAANAQAPAPAPPPAANDR